MTIAEVVRVLESIAPPAYAEEYDNVGLLVGEASGPCRRVLLCIDLTPAVLAEARRARAQMVMAYHPIIFRPITRITAETSPIAYQAARAGLAVYSVHTGYDAAVGGINDCLADALGMSPQRRPLSASVGQGQYSVAVFVPPANREAVASAAFAAGAGTIGKYRQCSFAAAGLGTFFGQEGTRPSVGEPGKFEEVTELRLEFLCPPSRLAEVLLAIRQVHAYEEPAINVCRLTDAPVGVGFGRVGRLEKPVAMPALLARLRKACGVARVMLAGPARARAKTLRTLAVCAGSGHAFLKDAIASKADIYVTGELRHHDALAASAAGLTVACVGHSNSERLALPTLARQMRESLPSLDVVISQVDRDPFESVG